MSITGDKDTQPYKVGVALIDVLTGMYATVGIIASLYKKEGQYIDISLFDSSISLLVNQAQNYLVSGKSPNRMGNSHPNISPYDLLHAKDGPLVVTVGNDRQFIEFAAVIGEPQLANDPKFQHNRARVQNRVELIQRVEELLKQDVRNNWIAKFQEKGIPCGSVNTIEQAFNEPQIQARDTIWNLVRENVQNSIPSIANPIKFLHNPMQKEDAIPPPLLGEHTDEILRDLLKLDENEISKLKQEGVV
jgi:crotonobetainyl-CoA:carnitine CoA-transferase CaiB-like acyl-CoA transferase